MELSFLAEEEIERVPKYLRRPVSQVPSSVRQRVVPHARSLVRDKNIVTLLCCLTNLECVLLSSFGLSMRFATILENQEPARVSKQKVHCTSTENDKSWQDCAIDSLEKKSRLSDRRYLGEWVPIHCLQSKKSRREGKSTSENGRQAACE